MSEWTEQRIRERERAAIAGGFSGLRITGDVAWIESADWRAMSLHEARLHAALHGRRVTALCSYPLERCGPHELIDVLRHHKSALLRRKGTWEHVGSAPAALALAASPETRKHHSVEFFDPGVRAVVFTFG